MSLLLFKSLPKNKSKSTAWIKIIRSIS